MQAYLRGWFTISREFSFRKSMASNFEKILGGWHQNSELGGKAPFYLEWTRWALKPVSSWSVPFFSTLSWYRAYICVDPFGVQIISQIFLCCGSNTILILGIYMLKQRSSETRIGLRCQILNLYLREQGCCRFGAAVFKFKHKCLFARILVITNSWLQTRYRGFGC